MAYTNIGMRSLEVFVGVRERRRCCGRDGGRDHGAEQRYERRRIISVPSGRVAYKGSGVGSLWLRNFSALVFGALVSAMCRRGRRCCYDFRVTSQLPVYFFIFATQTVRYMIYIVQGVASDARYVRALALSRERSAGSS